MPYWRSGERTKWCKIASMAKLLFACAAALLCLPQFAAAWQEKNVNPTSWSGVIINSGCTADEAFAEAAKCLDVTPGAKLVLYDDTTRRIYDLDPQSQAAGHLGDSVTVRGSLEGMTIHQASLEIFTPVGLPVGRKAPDFSARDQFGQAQTLETLRGTHGTVLLFFRSADW